MLWIKFMVYADACPLLSFYADDATPSPQPDSPVKPGSGVEGPAEAQQDTAEGKQEEEEEDDPCRSEGQVQFMIRNFSQLSDQVLSDPVFIRNLPWYEHMWGTFQRYVVDHLAYFEIIMPAESIFVADHNDTWIFLISLTIPKLHASKCDQCASLS